MDLTTVTFVGLATLGVVNVVTLFIPNIDSRYKFLISIVAAFGLTFVPAELSNVLLDKMKIAVQVAFAASGGYKLAQVVGAKRDERE
jgi:hypothetical protein